MVVVLVGAHGSVVVVVGELVVVGVVVVVVVVVVVDDVLVVGPVTVVVVVGAQGSVVGVVGVWVTRNRRGLVAVPSRVVTVTRPVVAPTGTMTVIRLSLSTVTATASTLLNATDWTSTKFVPVITTSVPTGPRCGAIRVIVGAMDGSVVVVGASVVVAGAAVVGGTVGATVGGGLVGGTVGTVGGWVGGTTMTVGGGLVGAGGSGTVTGTVVGGGSVVVGGIVVEVDASGGRVAVVEMESGLSPPVTTSTTAMPRTRAATTPPTVAQIWLRVIPTPGTPASRGRASLADDGREWRSRPSGAAQNSFRSGGAPPRSSSRSTSTHSTPRLSA